MPSLEVLSRSPLNRFISNLFLVSSILFLAFGILDYIEAIHENNPSSAVPRRANARELRSMSPLLPSLHTSGSRQPCRFTKPVTSLVTDDQGFLCSRTHTHPQTKCCIRTPPTMRYSCASCDHSLCCSHYEQCVSCCMSPSRANLRLPVHSTPFLRRYALKDDFELCSALCRSSSQSLLHENAYRHNNHHCFGRETAGVDRSMHHGLFDFATPIGNT